MRGPGGEPAEPGPGPVGLADFGQAQVRGLAVVPELVQVPELAEERNLLDDMFISLKRRIIESLNTAD